MSQPDTITRRQVAAFLDVHQDSVSRLLPQGLGYAVLSWGGHGKTMTFSRRLVTRWQWAWSCRARRGVACPRCRLVLEDAAAVAEHLIETRHGHGRCPACRPPGQLSDPCYISGGRIDEPVS